MLSKEGHEANWKQVEAAQKKGKPKIPVLKRGRPSTPSFKKYGLTHAEYYTLLLRAESKCEICRAPTYRRKLCVDHNHNTGKVRGLLCHACNIGIGSFKDDPHLFFKAIYYLTRFDPAVVARLKEAMNN